jgi:hypothetical protein
MSIQVTYPSDTPAAWDAKRADHQLAMKQASDTETSQYNFVLRSLQLFADLKTPLATEDRTTLGTAVYTVSAARWAEQKPKTAAILQGTADSLGMSLEALCAEIVAATQPAEFTAARVAIAQA